MPVPPTRPPALRGKLFRGSDQVRSGRLTKGQLRSAAWRRLFPDVYACASLAVDHECRARAAAALAVRGACISGRSAAVLWGVPLADADDDVELTVPPDCRAGAVRGIRISRRSLPADDVVVRGGVRVTTPIRTAVDVARIQPVQEAVVALDQVIGAGLLTLGELRRAASALGGPGCRSVRRAAELADGLAGSPQETRLRLVLLSSPLPRPVAQCTIRGAAGQFVARTDFAWPEAKVALEYEGVWHGQAQQVGRDRRRLNDLTAAGWTVVFATAADLRDPAGLIARLTAVLSPRRYG
ncbi:endonuclease domain-containing protein [Blastococcus sp. SYSU DS0617]